MPEITCATCGQPIDPSESTGQGFDGYMHLHVDRCVTLLKSDAARWRNAHDEIVKYAADKSEEASESLREAGAEITRLREEIAALRDDKARLDRLEHELLYNPAWPLIGCLLDGSLGILDMDAGSEFGDETVSDPTLRGAIDKAFARLDAARKGGKG